MKNIIIDEYENYLFTINENQEGYSQFLTTKELLIYNTFIDYYNYQWTNNEITRCVIKNKINDTFFSEYFLTQETFNEINKIFNSLNNVKYKETYIENCRVFAILCLLLYKLNKVCHISEDLDHNNTSYTNISINDMVKSLDFNLIDTYKLRVYSFIKKMKYNDFMLIEKLRKLIDDKYYEILLKSVIKKIGKIKFNFQKKYIFELFKYYSYLYLVTDLIKKGDDYYGIGTKWN